ncbi:MAG: sugar transferase [Candidatus Omnitrophica bacterium]|nr:sugar transferase [Candidatus Omnitrophota bacterium]
MKMIAYLLAKRLFDIFLAGFFLVLLSPIFLIVALIIKASSPGPVFYGGIRAGQGGRLFRMLKFRTMIANADKLGGSSTPEDDPRLTRVGRFLRRYKLDELPQFLNVLLGEMSFVGPRPQVEWATKLYTDEEKVLLSVLPGITDYASIRFRNEGEILRGSSDPDRDYFEKIASEKIRLGLEYVKNRSLKVDLRILLATVCALAGQNPDWIFNGNDKESK